MQGIDIYLTSPKGVLDQIGGEEAEVLAELWPRWNIGTFPIFQHIDPYDTTLFNGYQMPLIIREVKKLLEDDLSLKEKEVLAHLGRMALLCQEGSGRFLKFIHGT